jgi:hypothetical protein
VLGLGALLVALSAPGAARAAGCVHDGLRRSWQVEGAAHFEHLMASGALVVPAGVDLAERQPDPGPRPVCSGPMCSSNQGVPAPPVVSPMVEPSPWALLCARPGPEPADASFLDAVDECPRPSPVAGSVFHPPRIAAA